MGGFYLLGVIGAWGREMIAGTRYMAQMDEQRRINIERATLESALGVTLSVGGTVRLWALIGAKRQLQILAPTNELAKARDRFENSSLIEPPMWDSAKDERTDLIRAITSLLGVSCACEAKRTKLRLTVDADAERLGLIQTRAQMVVFAAGEILELWRHETWVESFANINHRELGSRLKEEFGESP